jgi:hypothetical protein
VDDGERMSPLLIKEEVLTAESINMPLVAQMLNMGFLSTRTIVASVLENKCDRACAT